MAKIVANPAMVKIWMRSVPESKDEQGAEGALFVPKFKNFSISRTVKLKERVVIRIRWTIKF